MKLKLKFRTIQNTLLYNVVKAGKEVTMKELEILSGKIFTYTQIKEGVFNLRRRKLVVARKVKEEGINPRILKIKTNPNQKIRINKILEMK